MSRTNTATRRKYDNDSRRRKRAELSRRIAAATAELHASLGPASTSYADIARQAGVSLPTVYSHFPSQAELFRGCTSHVARGAPELPIDSILGADNLPAAVEKLVLAMEGLHRYYEPWLAWRMDGCVEPLAEMSADVRRQQSQLVSMVLEHFSKSAPGKITVAGCETMLSFDCWHRLVRGHELSYRAARQILVRGVLAIIEIPA